MAWKLKESDFSDVLLCELATVIESNENCERGKVEAKGLETLLKLVGAKSL